MPWLFMRPVVGWGAFLLIHAIGIPAVYKLGKMCAAKQKNKFPSVVDESGANHQGL